MTLVPELPRLAGVWARAGASMVVASGASVLGWSCGPHTSTEPVFSLEVSSEAAWGPARRESPSDCLTRISRIVKLEGALMDTHRLRVDFLLLRPDQLAQIHQLLL